MHRRQIVQLAVQCNIVPPQKMHYRNAPEILQHLQG